MPKRDFSAASSCGAGAQPDDSLPKDCDSVSSEKLEKFRPKIRETLKRCKSYDVLSVSTQVAVLSIDIFLTVAFVAVQETGLNTCVLWDPVKRVFCGLLEPTDYIDILLYCHDNLDERKNVESYTIREWRDKQQKSCDSEGGVVDRNKSGSLSAPNFVTCEPETELTECLQRLFSSSARHIVVLANKEADDMSVLAILNMQQILLPLGAVLLSAEAADDGCRGAGIGPGDASFTGNGTHVADGYTFPNEVAYTAQMCTFSTLFGERYEDVFMKLGNDTRVDLYRELFDLRFSSFGGLGKHRNNPISVTKESTLRDALKRMMEDGIESIAVVEKEKIVRVIERSDIVRIEDQGVYDTELTVEQALCSIASKKICVFCANDTLRDIFLHFVCQKVSELYLVEPDTGRLLGQLNISEFVFFLVFGDTPGRNAKGDDVSSLQPTEAGGMTSSIAVSTAMSLPSASSGGRTRRKH